MVTRLAGRYQLVRQIGGGGQARVFQAVDTVTGTTLAAKVLRAEDDDSLEVLLRFQQEGAVLSTLTHPNIVEVYGTFLEGHTSYIIMELLDGQTLAEVMQTGPLPLERVRNLGRHVAAAIAFGHERGIVHRDIKPNNIMVVGNDHVKVTDFGIARILRQGLTLNTLTGSSVGTPLYMAPEQIEGEKVDGRADIYSLGAVLYQAVTGRPPFEGDDPLTIAFKHVHKAPQPPSELRPHLPEDWDALILKALAKNPADRFATAGELEKALTTLAVESDAGAGYPQPRPEPAADAPPSIDVETKSPRSPSAAMEVHPEDATPQRQDSETHVSPAGRDAEETRSKGERPDGAVQPVPTPREAPRADESKPATVARGASASVPISKKDTVARAARVVGAEARPAKTAAAGTEAPRKEVRRTPYLVGAAVLGIAAVGAGIFLLRPSSAATRVPRVGGLQVAGSRHGQGFVSGSRLRLSWKKVPGASYRMQIEPTGRACSFGDAARAIAAKHPVVSLTLLGERGYRWHVRAKVGRKWGPYSRVQSFLVDAPVVGRPRLIQPANKKRTTSRRVRLCWSPVSGAADYRVLLSHHPAITTRSTCVRVSLSPGIHAWAVAAQARGERLYTGPRSVARSFLIVRHKQESKRPAAVATTAASTHTVPAPTVAVYPTPTPVTSQGPSSNTYPTPTVAVGQGEQNPTPSSGSGKPSLPSCDPRFQTCP